MNRKVVNAVYLLLFAYCGIRLYTGSKQYGLTNYLRTLSSHENDPFITFIVPSLRLSTVRTTLKSITIQTEPNWEAIAGFDFQKKAPMSISKHFYRIKSNHEKGNSLVPANEDSHIWFELILRADHDDHNAAGGMYNHLMEFARGEWIAFVDDEDTVSPCFAEWLKRGIEKVSDESGEDNVPDLVLFRTQKEGSGVLPHPSQKAIVPGQAGKFFAVRKGMLTEQDIKFFPSPDEDYQLMWEVFSKGKKLSIASCVGYFIHGYEWDPKQQFCNVDAESSCKLVDTEVMEFHKTE